jgi:predicted ribonuclease YlaK
MLSKCKEIVPEYLEEEWSLKKYIVDTNILMSIESLADLIKNKSDGRITIPVYVIEELDNLKTKEATRGFQARRALRNIEASKGDLDFYLPRQHDAWYIPDSWDKDKVDNKIINYAVIENLSQEGMVVVLSNDLNVRLKCEAIGIKADTYFKAVKTYPGWTEVRMDFNHFVDFEEGRRNKWGIPVGQYLIIRDEEGHEIHGIYKYLGDKDWDQVMPQKLGNIAMGTISPKDAYQQCAVNSLGSAYLPQAIGKR